MGIYMTDTLILAFGLVLIIEGLAPALFPNKWRAYILKLAELPIEGIRNVGVFLIILGALITLFV